LCFGIRTAEKETYFIKIQIGKYVINVTNTGYGRKKFPIWEANKFKTKEDTANVFIFLESTQIAVLNLCRSYLKPYCMGRKTVLI
jgi:hypothetical protein